MISLICPEIGTLIRDKARMSKIDWGLVLAAGFFSVPINTLFTYTYDISSNLIDAVLTTGAVVVLVVSSLVLVNNYNHSKLGRARKLRLVFLGISLFSFLFAVQDMIVFLTGVRGFQLSNDLPYLWLGSVPVPSLLGSLLIGALFNLAERFVDVMGTR